MNFNVTELIKWIIDNYGVAGFALLFWAWHGWQMQKKIENLQGSCNKMFGIMLALADKRSREKSIKTNRGSFDD